MVIQAIVDVDSKVLCRGDRFNDRGNRVFVSWSTPITKSLVLSGLINNEFLQHHLVIFPQVVIYDSAVFGFLFQKTELQFSVIIASDYCNTSVSIAIKSWKSKP